MHVRCAGYMTSFTGAQNYLHQLAGLTTTSGGFTSGCNLREMLLPLNPVTIVLGSRLLFWPAVSPFAGWRIGFTEA
jgi:hypothetical protein